MELLNALKLGKMGFKPDQIKEINASGIESKEIIALAENGYTFDDVSELIKLTQSDESILQPGNKTPEDEPAKGDGNTGDHDKINYKEVLEQKEKEMEALKAQVSKLQDQMASKDLSGGKPEKTVRQQVQEALSSLY